MATTSTPAVIERFFDIRRENAVYRHAGEVPELDVPDQSVRVERVTKSLLDRLDLPTDAHVKFRRFLEEGHQGFIVHDGGEPVARGWTLTPESTHVPYNLPDWVADLDVYWLFYARTYEGHRRKGWHKYLMRRRLEQIYQREPDAWVYTDAVPENVSRYTFLSSGFEPAGMMATYRLGHPSVAVKQVGTWDRHADHPPLPGDDE